MSMVKVTLEVPEPLLGDIYIAVGKVLRSGQDDWDEVSEQAEPGYRDDDDEPADET
jgi:hypothetical protein